MRIYEIIKGVPEPTNDNVDMFPGLTHRRGKPASDARRMPYMHVGWETNELDPKWPMGELNGGTLIVPPEIAPDLRFHGQGLANDNARLDVIRRK